MIANTSPSPVRLLLEVLAIVALAELAVMLVLPFISPDLGPTLEGVLDVTLLMLLSGPPVMWRIRQTMGSFSAFQMLGQSKAALHRRAIVVAVVVQISGLVLTAGLVVWKKASLEVDLQAQFSRKADSVVADLAQRFARPLSGLQGLKAHYAAQPEVHRAAFEAWVDAYSIATEFHGIRGFGFVEHVQRTDLPAYVRRQRADGAPSFTVHPLSESPDLFVVSMVAPLQANLVAVGLDLGAEPRRRAAAEQALRTNLPTLSAKVELVQDAGKTPGFLYMIPVQSDVVKGRKSAPVRGLVYTPIVASELLQGVASSSNGTLRLRVYEGAESTDNLVFDSHPDTPEMQAASHSVQAAHKQYAVGEHTLTLRFDPTPLQETAADNPLLAVIGVGGTAISSLLTLGIWLLLIGRVRAEAIAVDMTKDLSRLARVARHTTNAVAVLDTQGRITWVNEGFTRLTGYAFDEAIGHAPGEILSSGHSNPESVQALEDGIREHKVVRVEMVNRAKDGHEYWIETEVSPFFGEMGKLEGFIEVGADVSRQKKMQLQLEEAIRSSQTLLNTLEMLALVSFADRHGKITHVNDAFCEGSGYTREELVGSDHSLVNSKQHSEAFWQEMWTTIQSGMPWRGEVCNRRKNGELYWVDSMIAPFIGDDGLVERYVTIRIEITQRKKNEAALAQATKRLELAIEGGNDGLWDWMDVRHDEQWWAPNYYHLLGYTEEEMPASSSNFTSLLHPDFLALNARNAQEIAAGKSAFELEVQMRTKEHGYRWFRTRGKVYRDADGTPLRMAGATQDIHEAKLISQALAANEAFLATAGRVSGVGGWKVDLLTNSLTWTTETRKIHEVDDGFMPTLDNIMQFYPPQALADIRATMQRAVQDGAAWDMEMPFVTAKGRSIWVRTVGAVEYADGKPVALIGAFQDVTERRAAEERLREALTAAESATVAKGQFLANMSHEIRTPMNAILGMLSLMEKTDLSQQQEDYVNKTKSAAGSLLGLLNDILDLSKVEAGKMELDPQPVEIEALLRDLSVILSAYVAKKPVEVLYDLDSALPPAVVVDPTRLKQVLINLAGNAVKFTAAGEVVVRVKVVARQDQQADILFAVSDTGIGISPEQQTRLFSSFTQAEASTTRKFGGTGLGLAISQQLVRMMGGEIRIDSEMGKGSTFHFTLPLQVVEPDAVAQSAPDTVRRVLLVEDNAMARKLTQAMCEANGWDCVVADSGEAALQQMQDNAAQGLPPFDAVLMDWMLPGMDGWAATNEIRKRSALQGHTALRVVMLTAHNRESLQERPDVDHELINAYLVKPVTAALLREAVYNVGNDHQIRKTRRSTGRRALAGLRLLVVEDNLINQQVAEELLTHEGALVSLAANGQLGVEAVSAAKPQFDAVLMDVQMPVMDGYAATAFIRHQLGLRDLPIIAMTANAMSTDRAECIAAGMDEHVGKPFDIRKLAPLILRIMGREDASPGMDTAQLTLAEAITSNAAPQTTPDIDVVMALQRMSGLKSAYLRCAKDFLVQLQSEEGNLRNNLGDPKAATMQMHTLKGTSALLGCNALSQEAARLEKLCKAHALDDVSASVPALGELLQRTAADFVQALQALEPGFGSAAPPSAAASQNAAAFDGTAVRQALLQLQPLLEGGDLSALEVFAQQRDALSALPEDLFMPLEDALQSLELEDALQALHKALAAASVPQAA